MVRVIPDGVVNGEHLVGAHGEPPAGGEGLQPVVAAAQAAQVGAVGGAAAGVRDDVVGVGPSDPLAAAGEAAGAVAGVHEHLLRGGGCVAVDRGGPVEHRAGAVGAGMGSAAAADEAAQPVEGGGGAQGTVVVGERQRHRPARRRAHAKPVEAGEQLPELTDGDR
ncbi:hypothetical protein [Geodermatophilus dictyosporus]|uniref:hypothetical protein n=1 Tax=Geodermatophilus dictyosporus TaxID=1523247 RepID=UPI00145C397A|nr:hypothetical protein [Geodermatophilus dictyosporus]